MPMAAAAETSCPGTAVGVLVPLALRLLRLAPVRLLVIDVVVWSDGDDELATSAGAACCGGGGGLAAAGVGRHKPSFLLSKLIYIIFDD